MDPNEALRWIRLYVEAIEDTESEWRRAELADDLAEHVEALDVWLTRGGFLPRAWEQIKSERENSA